MPDHSSHGPRTPDDAIAIDQIAPPPSADDEAAVAEDPGDGTHARRRRVARAPRTDWRLGGRAVRRWREWLLGGALVSLGISIAGAALIASLWESPWAEAVAIAVIWLVMLAPVVWAIALARPVGLFRFRAVDLLYGLVLGVALRLVQGWVQWGTEGAVPLPSYALVDGALPDTWWLVDGLGAGVVSPVVEELFFRAVILVALYSSMRRAFGRLSAAVVAITASTGLFVLVHGLAGGVGVDHVLALTALGVACSLLVVLTGRIWGAILVHVVFNASFIVISLAGTL